MSKVKDLIPLAKAAQRIGMARERCRQLCIQTGIAVRWGGTDEHPRLRVNMEELEAAVLAQRYQPPKQQAQPRTFRRVRVTCPDVKC